MGVDQSFEEKIKQKFPFQESGDTIRETCELILAQLPEEEQEYYQEILLDIKIDFFCKRLKKAAIFISSLSIESRLKEDFLKKILVVTQGSDAWGKLEAISKFFKFLNTIKYDYDVQIIKHFFQALLSESWENIHSIYNNLSQAKSDDDAHEADYQKIILKNILTATPKKYLEIKNAYEKTSAEPCLALLAAIANQREPLQFFLILLLNPNPEEETPYWELIDLLERTQELPLEEKPNSLKELINYCEDGNEEIRFRRIFAQIREDHKFSYHPAKQIFSHDPSLSNFEKPKEPSPLQQFSITNSMQTEPKAKEKSPPPPELVMNP